MGRKSTSSSTSAPQTQKPVNPFVNYDLTLEDKSQLKKLNPQPEEINSALAALVKEGYKVSISWDDYSDCIQCFLIAQAKELVNHPYILTARANSLDKALASLVYKHKSVFAGVWHHRVIEGKPSDDY